MHAIVATVSIENVEEALTELEDKRVAVVKRAPGFLSAYWLAPIDFMGMSIMVFETEEDAEAAAAAARSIPAIPGVEVVSVEVRKVHAHA